MNNVVTLELETKQDVPVEKVLQGALEGKLLEVVVIGFSEGENLYFATSKSYAPDILWALECAKRELQKRADL